MSQEIEELRQIDLSSVVSASEVKRMRKVIKLAHNYLLNDLFLLGCVVVLLLFLFGFGIYFFLWVFNWIPAIQPVAFKQFFIGVGLLIGIFVIGYYVTFWRRKYYYRMIDDRMRTLLKLVEVVDCFNQNVSDFGSVPISPEENSSEKDVTSTRQTLLTDQKIILQAMKLFKQEKYRDVRVELFCSPVTRSVGRMM